MDRVIIHNPNSLDLLDIKELHPLQGDYKVLNSKEYTKLYNSIIEHGFSFSIKVWASKEGIHFIVGGHQRLKVLKKSFTNCMVIDYINTEKGSTETNRVKYDSIKVPVEFIRAKNKKEAIKLLLLDDSRFGITNKESTFIRDSFDEGIDLDGLNIYDLDLSEFKIDDEEEVLNEIDNNENLDKLLQEKQEELEKFEEENNNLSNVENNANDNNKSNGIRSNTARNVDMGFDRNDKSPLEASSSITITVPTKYLEQIEKKLAETPIISIGNEKEQVKRGRRLIKLLLNIDDTSI